MNSLKNTGAHAHQPGISFSARTVPIAAGLAAIALTSAAFILGTGAWPIAAVAGIGAAYVSVCLLYAPGSPIEAQEAGPLPADQLGLADLEDRLIALDEANEFFATSLGAHDMFRLVASRVSEIFPFAACVLAVPDESRQTLKFVYADGANAESLRQFEFRVTDGLAGRAFSSGRIEIDRRMMTEMKCLGTAQIDGFTSAAAVPLLQTDGEPFAVFELFMDSIIAPDPAAAALLERIGDHVTPIFRGSLAYERSLSNALTDPITGLPNERAFYMVLENQLAESQRHRDDRPLTVLSIDIRDFGAVNSMLGHATGDRMLEFTAARIGEQLRKMDFLARTVNDEFHVILPTATAKVAFEIIERIKAGFAKNEFEISHGEGVLIALNIGWSTFWKDGETAQQIVRAAQQRKREAKCQSPSGVLWFPREYVN